MLLKISSPKSDVGKGSPGSMEAAVSLSKQRTGFGQDAQSVGAGCVPVLTALPGLLRIWDSMPETTVRCVIQRWLMSTRLFCSFVVSGQISFSRVTHWDFQSLASSAWSASSCQLLCYINLEPSTFPNTLCVVEQVLLGSVRPDVQKRRAPV